MRTIGLKLKNYAGGISIVDSGNLERRVLHFLLLSFGALAIFYILILGNMVFNIVERRHLEDRVRVLSGEVGNLELSYLSVSNSVDLNLSHALGFKEIDVKFATRKALGSIKVSQNDI
jgi:hypothetical protein